MCEPDENVRKDNISFSLLFSVDSCQGRLKLREELIFLHNTGPNSVCLQKRFKGGFMTKLIQSPASIDQPLEYVQKTHCFLNQ